MLFGTFSLLWAKDTIQSLGGGTTYKEISGAVAATIPSPLAPLPEQRRIVAEIEKQFTRLDASVQSLKRAQANLKRYRASVLKAACDGTLVATEAELARAEGRDYEPASVPAGTHPGRTPRPLGVPGEEEGQVQGTGGAGYVGTAGVARGVGVGDLDQVVFSLEGGMLQLPQVFLPTERSLGPAQSDVWATSRFGGLQSFCPLLPHKDQATDITAGDLLFTRLSGTFGLRGELCGSWTIFLGESIEWASRQDFSRAVRTKYVTAFRSFVLESADNLTLRQPLGNAFG